jgi:P4 family phage/plasmid primase-like protien
MAQQNDNLARFLKEHQNKNKKDAHRVTHTRIPDAENNIFGGSYIIEGEDEVTLHNLIYTECVRGNRMEYLTEVQRKGEPATWIVDLDFRYAHDVGVRQHTDEWIIGIIGKYLEVMADYYDVDETPINIYICEKPQVNQLADGTLTKDGVHLVFSVDIPHKIQMEIRRRMIAECNDMLEDLPLINNADAVFDKGLSQGGTNWQLLGCRKPTYDKYRVVTIIKAQLDPSDGEWMLGDADRLQQPITREQYGECCVRSKHHRWEPNERGQAVLNPPTAINKPRAVMVGGDGFEDVLALTRMLKPDRAESGNYEKWRNVGMAIKNILGEEGRALFEDWTRTFSSAQRYSEWEDQWEHYAGKGEGKITIGSLHYWAKEDSPAEYKTHYAEQFKVLTENSIADAFSYALTQCGTDNAHAKLFAEIYKGKFVCTDYTRGVYQEFKANCLWAENVGGAPIRLLISGAYRDKFVEHMQAMQAEASNEDAVPEEAEVLKKRIKQLGEMCLELEKVGKKNNIQSSIKDIINDPEFLKDMNKEKMVLPLRGQKVINLQTLEVTPRTENHKYNYECDFEYIPELSEEDEQWVIKYWEDMFIGKKDTVQTVLDILKSSLIGKPNRYIYFLTGTGRNGKSTLINMLKPSLGRAIDAVSKSVIVQSKASSTTTTELEKLDKTRIAYASEFDDQQDTLNMVVIKAITGGDAIDCRGLYKTNETLTPTANLMVLTNNLPKFKVEQSTLDRVIVIPFGAVFEKNNAYEDEVISKRSQIMSFILKHGRILDKFELSEDMRVAGEEYKNDQEDTLKDFIADRTVKDANCWIDRDQFRMGYNDWCSIRKLKQDTSSNNSFTRAMAKHGYAVKSAGTKKRYLGIKWDNTPQASAGGGGADAETDIGETDDQWE